MSFKYKLFSKPLTALPTGKILINTLNAHSYNAALNNNDFKEALMSSNVLLPDGISVVWAEYFINKRKIKKIAGEDIFKYEMRLLNSISGTCFFLGSSQDVLNKIYQRAYVEFPNVKTGFYSPPYKSHFTNQDTQKMLDVINSFVPDVLFVGMTAPKQEIWAHQNFKKIKAKRVISIGAVFDFYAGTVKRAPKWMISLGFEWIYRLIREPKRMWRRYLIGNLKFIAQILKTKINAEK